MAVRQCSAMSHCATRHLIPSERQFVTAPFHSPRACTCLHARTLVAFCLVAQGADFHTWNLLCSVLTLFEAICHVYTPTM